MNNTKSLMPYQKAWLKGKTSLYIFKDPSREVMETESMSLCEKNCLSKPNLTQWIFKPSHIINEKLITEFKNGSKIILLTGDDSILCGKGGNLIINNFDLYSDPGELYKFAYSFTIWGGELGIFYYYDPGNTGNPFFSQLIKQSKPYSRSNSYERRIII